MLKMGDNNQFVIQDKNHFSRPTKNKVAKNIQKGMNKITRANIFVNTLRSGEGLGENTCT